MSAAPSLAPPSLAPPSATASRDEASVDRFVEVTARMHKVLAVGAITISGLAIVTAWGDWRGVLALVGATALLAPFNAWINAVVLRRSGLAQIELVRTALNILVNVGSMHLAHWPLPCWLWLPYVALAYDQLGRRIGLMVLAAFCTSATALALLDGVPWSQPLTFVGLAVVCAMISGARTSFIGRMLIDGDVRRAELARAHGKLRGEVDARRRVEGELRQAQKLEAVGRLASGVAHEINTPIQFVGDSLTFVRAASTDLLALADAYRAALERVRFGASVAEAIEEMREAEDVADVAYLRDELPLAVSRAAEGVARVATIVRSLKQFAHPDELEKAPVDVNAALATTLVIARNEYKYVADVKTELGDVPAVRGHLGELNQAFLNVLVNAAHAIADNVAATGARGTISVKTHREGSKVVIEIADTGGGIPDEVQPRVFDPFFTTKEVGRGTGQGLAITRSVVESHRGSVSFRTEKGRGTTFRITLPAA